MLSPRVVLLSALTSLASTMVVGPHHAAATHAGEAPNRASGRTWFGRASQLEIGLSFCVLVAISPRRAKLGGGGGVPRGMRPASTPPPIPAAGAPPAGPWQGPFIWPFDAKPSWHHTVVCDNSQSFLLLTGCGWCACVAKYGSLAMTCAPRGLAPPVGSRLIEWQV
jgi:hypothetical protein